MTRLGKRQIEPQPKGETMATKQGDEQQTTYSDPQKDEYTLWFTSEGVITHTASESRGWPKTPGSTGSHWLDKQFRDHVAEILRPCK